MRVIHKVIFSGVFPEAVVSTQSTGSSTTELMLRIVDEMSDTILWLSSFAGTCKAWYSFSLFTEFWLNRALRFGFSIERLRQMLPDYQSPGVVRGFIKSCVIWRRCPTKLGPQITEIPHKKDPPIEFVRDVATTIRLNGRCAYSTWLDHEGSCGTSYFSLCKRGEELALEDFVQFRTILNDGMISPHVSLEKQLQPILRLFGGGKYSMRVIHKVIFSGVFPLTMRTSNYYPSSYCYYGEQLYTTDKFPNGDYLPFRGQYNDEHFQKAGMDVDRINHYKTLISEGFRPLCLVIAAEPYQPSTLKNFKKRHLPLTFSWLLDGHHKLLAYFQLNIFPSVLRIEFMGSPHQISREEHVVMLTELKHASQAVRVMREYCVRPFDEQSVHRWRGYELSDQQEKQIIDILKKSRN
eukprot:TRINITY_DN3761_c0_g2_i3.p1 TRINITY_DN3761_c0_g2~~TRINITY_DN3761_c0_g2_i3.p1  ORF type:complete len:468 (+),score=64.61 TRINITY_DN3761_c0_g2_i3:181-1404(+)